MLKKYATTQIYKVYRSHSVIVGFCLLHSIAFAAVFLSTIALLYKIIIAGLVVISLLFYLKQEIKFSGLHIRYGSVFGWEIAYSENHFQSILILPSTVLTPYIVVLHFKQQNTKKQTILICRDALKKDEFRKLMVELKISGLQKDVL